MSELLWEAIKAHKHQHDLFVYQIGTIHQQMDDQDGLVGKLGEQNAQMEQRLQEVTEELEARKRELREVYKCLHQVEEQNTAPPPPTTTAVSTQTET
jgi:chromosome segregation ATPase